MAKRREQSKITWAVSGAHQPAEELFHIDLPSGHGPALAINLPESVVQHWGQLQIPETRPARCIKKEHPEAGHKFHLCKHPVSSSVQRAHQVCR